MTFKNKEWIVGMLHTSIGTFYGRKCNVQCVVLFRYEADFFSANYPIHILQTLVRPPVGASVRVDAITSQKTNSLGLSVSKDCDLDTAPVCSGQTGTICERDEK